jgi:hypothetical protein
MEKESTETDADHLDKKSQMIENVWPAEKITSLQEKEKHSEARDRGTDPLPQSGPKQLSRKDETQNW